MLLGVMQAYVRYGSLLLVLFARCAKDEWLCA